MKSAADNIILDVYSGIIIRLISLLNSFILSIYICIMGIAILNSHNGGKEYNKNTAGFKDNYYFMKVSEKQSIGNYSRIFYYKWSFKGREMIALIYSAKV